MGALATFAFAASLALAGAAAASHLDLSLTAGNAERVAGVYLEVPVDVTCPADLSSPPYTFLYAQDMQVRVTQKSGKSFSRGEASFSYFDNSLFGGETFGVPLTCDGTPHTYVMNVFPSPGSGPFHGGKAAVQIDLYVDLRDPNNPFGLNHVTRASVTQTISIRG